MQSKNKIFAVTQKRWSMKLLNIHFPALQPENKFYF